MTEALLIPPAGASSRDEDHDPYRPASPDRGVGRWLRRVAGVDEDILDWVPEERPRYTRLGAIVANTGLLAALSMLVLLSTVIDVPWPLLVPIAGIWGYVILSLDGWLVSSTHGTGFSKVRALVPRLVLSILISLVIAEPLLLWLLSPAIHTEVRDQRDQEIAEFRGQLVTCNQLSGEPLDAVRCPDEFIVGSTDDLRSVQSQLESAIEEQDAVEIEIGDLEDNVERLEGLARAECTGQTVPGVTTGIPGQGHNCQRDRDFADAERRRLEERQQRRDELDTRIRDLTDQAIELSEEYGATVRNEIAREVADKRDNQEQISLLDEDRALQALSAESTFVLVGQWLLRLLLVAVDSLPVLVKLMGRTTTYDVLYTRQLEVDNRLHDQHQTVREQRDLGIGDVEIQRNAQQVRARVEAIDEADRATRANREAALDVQIEELAARLRNDPST
jgi:hypothetical protein